MRCYLVSLLFLCIVVPSVAGTQEHSVVVDRIVIDQNDNVSAAQWFVLANCASFCTHAVIENTYKAAVVSLGIMGALYLWEYLIHARSCGHSHVKNLLAVLLGGGEGGFCGYWARSFVNSKSLPKIMSNFLSAPVVAPLVVATAANQAISKVTNSVGNPLPAPAAIPLIAGAQAAVATPANPGAPIVAHSLSVPVVKSSGAVGVPVAAALANRGTRILQAIGPVTSSFIVPAALVCLT